MAVTCQSCKKSFKVGPEHAGKTVKCPCGSKFVVPASSNVAVSSSAPVQAVAIKSPATAITVRCACGASLKAPANAAGKAIRCKCGKAVPVPAAASQATSPARAAQGAVASAVPSPATGLDAALPNWNLGATSASPLFSLAESEWKVAEPAKKPIEEKPKKKEGNPYLERASAELKGSKKDRTESAGQEMMQSRLILVGLGGFKVALNIFQLFFVQSEIDAMVSNNPDSVEIANTLSSIMYVIYGMGIGIGALFMILGFLVFLLPLTCTISAMALFIITEIVSLLLNPFQLFSIRGWMIRGAIFGGLVQAINNASYFRYAKKLAKEKN